LNKIRELRAIGKSLLFVSHNPGAVIEFCDRAIWLHEGEMVMDGPAPGVVKRYTEFMARPGSRLPASEQLQDEPLRTPDEPERLATKRTRGQR
jgi:ABC-type glutathione transport system ATPase component